MEYLPGLIVLAMVFLPCICAVIYAKRRITKEYREKERILQEFDYMRKIIRKGTEKGGEMAENMRCIYHRMRRTYLPILMDWRKEKSLDNRIKMLKECDFVLR